MATFLVGSTAATFSGDVATFPVGSVSATFSGAATFFGMSKANIYKPGILELSQC